MDPMVQEAKVARACAPKWHQPALGHAFRVTGFMPVAQFVIWKAVMCHIDLFERS